MDLGVSVLERRVRESADGRAGPAAGEHRLGQDPEDAAGCDGPGGGAGPGPAPAADIEDRVAGAELGGTEQHIRERREHPIVGLEKSGCVPASWSVTSTRPVMAGSRARSSGSMPCRSVTSARLQPWQPRGLHRGQVGGVGELHIQAPGQAELGQPLAHPQYKTRDTST
jgi:hypothetical protein